MQTQFIDISKIIYNSGQIDGVPENPRSINRKRLDDLKRSIQDAPEMLELRELIVYPYNGKYIVIGGNMRLKACKSLNYKQMPCKVLDAETPAEKLKQYIIKDNVGFGKDDWEKLSTDWNVDELEDWGMKVQEWEEKPQARSTLKPKISIITKPNLFVICNFAKSKESGELLTAIKENPTNAEVFADEFILTVQKVLQMVSFDGWCLITAPKRRHVENNFAERICNIVSDKTGLKFYKDVFICRTKQRINPTFTMQKEIKEKNIILYDDIITTGSTLQAMRNLLPQCNVVCFAGINNN